MVRLYVNVDHVATLRQQRDTRYPDPVVAAALCELAGADGITVHLREDRRHAQDRDVRVLRETVQGVFNLEMAAVDQMVRIACEIKPEHMLHPSLFLGNHREQLRAFCSLYGVELKS